MVPSPPRLRPSPPTAPEAPGALSCALSQPVGWVMALFNWMNESDFDLDRLEDRARKGLDAPFVQKYLIPGAGFQLA